MDVYIGILTFPGLYSENFMLLTLQKAKHQLYLYSILYLEDKLEIK